MGTSINLLRRYVWLVETIRRSRSITLEEINEKWREERTLRLKDEDEIPPRTFFRHRNAIADLFGIDISCNRHDGNKYYIENEEALSEPTFTSWLFNWLNIDNQLSGNPEVAERILHEESPGGYSYLATIIEALVNKRNLSFTYKKYNNGGTSKPLVSPYGLKQSDRRWYLLSKREGCNNITVYALDRMSDIHITDNTFEFDEMLNIKSYFDEVIGINLDDELDVESVRIRVYGNQRPFFENLQLHKSQKVVEKTKDYIEFEFNLRPEIQFQQSILKYAQDIEVISPRWLREEMIWRAEEMLKRYGKNDK